MAHFIFNGYVNSVSKFNNATTGPVASGSAVGVALVTSSALTADSTTSDVLSLLATDGSDKAVKSMPNIEIGNNSATGSAYEVVVKSKAVSFGQTPTTTNISAIGAVVYFKSTGSVTEYDDTDFNSDAANTVPVCFLDFGETVTSSDGPFRVIFNGGSGSGDSEVSGVVFKYKQTNS